MVVNYSDRSRRSEAEPRWTPAMDLSALESSGHATSAADPFDDCKPLMKIDVEELAKVHDAEIETFLDELSRQSPAVLAYHYPFYRDMLVELGIGTPQSLGAYRGDALVGLLAVFERQSEAGIAHCSLPYFGPNAGVVCSTGPEQEAIHAALLGCLLERARAKRRLELRSTRRCSVGTSPCTKRTGPTPWWRGSPNTPRFRTRPGTAAFVTICGVPTGWALRYPPISVPSGSRHSTRSTSRTARTRYTAQVEAVRRVSHRSRTPEPPRVGLRGPARGTRGWWTPGAGFPGNGQLLSPLFAARSPRALQPGTLLINRAFRDLEAAGARLWNWEALSQPRFGCLSLQGKMEFHRGELPYLRLVLPRDGVPEATGQGAVGGRVPLFLRVSSRPALA